MIPPKSVPQEMNISGMDIVSIVWHDTAGIDMDCHDFFRKSQKGFAPQFSKWHNTTSVNCLRFRDRVLQTWFGQSDQSFTSCPHLTWQIESLFGNLSKSASKPWNAMVPRFHRQSVLFCSQKSIQPEHRMLHPTPGIDIGFGFESSGQVSVNLICPRFLDLGESLQWLWPKFWGFPWLSWELYWMKWPTAATWSVKAWFSKIWSIFHHWREGSFGNRIWAPGNWGGELVMLGVFIVSCLASLQNAQLLMMCWFFEVFIVISSFMMLNMLLGILVEVVANTAEGPLSKREERTIAGWILVVGFNGFHSTPLNQGEKNKEKNTIVRQASSQSFFNCSRKLNLFGSVTTLFNGPRQWLLCSMIWVWKGLVYRNRSSCCTLSLQTWHTSSANVLYHQHLENWKPA